jgi:hypothetical protein
MNNDKHINDLIQSSLVFLKKHEINPESDFAKQHRKRVAPKKNRQKF